MRKINLALSLFTLLFSLPSFASSVGAHPMAFPEKFVIDKGVVKINGTPVMLRGIWNAFPQDIFEECNSKPNLGAVNECRVSKAEEQAKKLSSLLFNFSIVHLTMEKSTPEKVAGFENKSLARMILEGIHRWNIKAPSLDRRFYVVFSGQKILYLARGARTYDGSPLLKPRGPQRESEKAANLIKLGKVVGTFLNDTSTLSGFAGVILGDEPETTFLSAKANSQNISQADKDMYYDTPNNPPTNDLNSGFAVYLRAGKAKVKAAAELRNRKLLTLIDLMSSAPDVVRAFANSADIVAKQNHHYGSVSNYDSYVPRLFNNASQYADHIESQFQNRNQSTMAMGVPHAFGSFLGVDPVHFVDPEQRPDVYAGSAFTPPNHIQYRAIAFSWIIAGANGITPFSYTHTANNGIKPPGFSIPQGRDAYPKDLNAPHWKIDAPNPVHGYPSPSDPIAKDVAGSTLLWNALVRTNIHLSIIAPTLLSGEKIGVSASPGVKVRAHMDKDRIVVVALNTNQSEGIKTIQLPASIQGSASVLTVHDTFQPSRTPLLVRAGTIRDHFEKLEVQIYIIPKR